MLFKSYNFFRKRGYRRSSIIIFQSPIVNRLSPIVYRHLQLAFRQYYSVTVFVISYFPFVNRRRHQPSAISHQSLTFNFIFYISTASEFGLVVPPLLELYL
jgi:hypothetical protein